MEDQYLPVVVHAEYKGGYLIEVEFDNGVKKLIDFGQWLNGPIFEPLKDKMYFRSFFLDGWTVAWPNGADIAPETLYDAEGLPASSLEKHEFQTVD
jgi:hypothetical protein